MKVNLDKIDSRAPKSADKEKIKEETTKLILKMRECQQLMFAQQKYNILIIFQGMDASGKDNAIKKVFGGLNPLGCNAVAFGKPTAEEYSHDFLRRVHKHAPARGMVQIFNRSYYEDILVPTVQKTYPEKMIDQRYDDINNFENLLQENDTIILKFFLHISKEKQEEKIRERLVTNDKLWKFDTSDIQARQNREHYQKTYEKIFDKCDQQLRHIIPADQKWYKNHLITKIIIETFEKKMKLERPDLDPGEEQYKEMYTGKNKDKKLAMIKPKPKATTTTTTTTVITTTKEDEIKKKKIENEKEKMGKKKGEEQKNK